MWKQLFLDLLAFLMKLMCISMGVAFATNSVGSSSVSNRTAIIFDILEKHTLLMAHKCYNSLRTDVRMMFLFKKIASDLFMISIF